ncbi:hypothetical protein A3781_09345 [Bacillus badius]|nr:Late competence protein ComGD [Bacillus badius]KZR60369.1 hypothetical protein A3781_09345 [Bacillus badius]
MFNKMKKAIKEEQGFTMIETMVVLAVVLVVLSITVLSFSRGAAEFEKRQFLNQLRADLFLAQSHAIAKQETVEVRFAYGGNRYTVRTLASSSSFLVQRNIPDAIQYMDGSLAKLSFLPNGNTNSFGTVYFKYGDRYLSLVFQIGKGRFYVKEQ